MKKILGLFILFLLLAQPLVRAGEYWVKEDTDEWFPVILLSSTDGVTEVTGKTFSDTTVQYAAQSATSWTAYTDDTNTFKETGNGAYWVQIGESEFANNTRYIVRVTVSGSLSYRFLVNAIDNTINETVVNINDIETDTNALNDTKVPDTISLAAIADSIWDEARAGHVTAGTFGQGVASVQGNVTGSVASVSGAVGSVTAGVTVTTNNDKTGYSISGTKTTLDALNDVSAATVNTQVDTALSDIGLDHLLSASVTGTDITDNSIIAKLVSKSATADWDSFSNTTDSLEALRDRGDAAWITATGFSTHSAADVWAVATRTITGGTIDTNNDKTGYRLSATGVDDIWDEVQSGHSTSGTFGKYLDDEITSRSSHSAADTADAVWDEARAGHTTAGTFGQGVASVQGNVTGSVASVSGAVGSVTAGVTVTTNNDKTGYSLTQTFPTNFADLAITSSTGRVTVGTNADKTGYSISGTKTTLDALNDVSAAGVWAAATRTITGGTIDTNSDKTGYRLSATGIDDIWDEAQSGHATAGTFGKYLDAQVSTVSSPSVGSIADAVWDEARSGHVSAGTFGEGVASVQGNVTGSTASVTAGVTVTTNNDKTGYRLSATGVDDVWDEAQSGHTTAGTFGKYLDAQVSAASSPTVGAIADAVFDEAISGHTTAGTFGASVQSLLDYTDGDKESGAYSGIELLIRKHGA